MPAVVLDTNFLLLPFQRSIDLDSEIERVLEQPYFYVVLKQCIDELRGMASRKRKESRASRAALSFIQRRGISIEKGFSGPADSALVDYCAAKKAVLCTLDTDLRRAAKKLGVKVICLRGKSHLGI